MALKPTGRRYLHWPLAWRRAHTLAIALLPILLATGIALYYPPVHTVLIPYLIIIYDLHIALGLLWLVLILWPIVVAPRFAGRRTLSGLDWLPLLALGIGTPLTGIVLVVPGLFSAAWRSLEFTGHGLFALLLAVAVAAHGVARWRKVVVRDTRFDPERQAFARFALYGAVAAFALPWLVRVPGALGGRTGPKGSDPDASAIENDFVTYTAADFIPQIADSAYRLTVDGAVDAPYTVTFEELKALPSVEIVKDFQCVTGWVVPNVHWQGVRVADLVARAGPRPGNGVVRFHSQDGLYTDTLDGSDQVDLSDVILAYAIEGGPLPAERGGPVRLVVPPMFGYKSVKWVNRLEITDHVVPGFWETQGYAINAWLSAPPGEKACAAVGAGICG